MSIWSPKSTWAISYSTIESAIIVSYAHIHVSLVVGRIFFCSCYICTARNNRTFNTRIATSPPSGLAWRRCRLALPRVDRGEENMPVSGRGPEAGPEPVVDCPDCSRTWTVADVATIQVAKTNGNRWLGVAIAVLLVGVMVTPLSPLVGNTGSGPRRGRWSLVCQGEPQAVASDDDGAPRRAQEAGIEAPGSHDIETGRKDAVELVSHKSWRLLSLQHPELGHHHILPADGAVRGSVVRCRRVLPAAVPTADPMPRLSATACDHQLPAQGPGGGCTAAACYVILPVTAGSGLRLHSRSAPRSETKPGSGKPCLRRSTDREPPSPGSGPECPEEDTVLLCRTGATQKTAATGKPSANASYCFLYSS